MSCVALLGSWGPPLLAVARSCRRRGLRVHLLEVGAQRCRWRLYSASLAGGDAVPAPEIGTPRGLARIRQGVSAADAEALVALDDARLVWLARHRGALGPRCKLLAPPAETLGFLHSKRNQIGLARSAGFDVLPTAYLSAAAERPDLPPAEYPLVVRPDRKSGPRDPFKVRLVRGPAELAALLDAWDGNGGPLVAQRFLPLPNLVVHGARAEDGTILALRAFLVPRTFEGVTLTIRAAALPPGVERSCRAFAAAAGLTGCFHFELLAAPEQGRAWFLEVNPRLGGTTDKVTRLGFDETAYLLGAYGIRPPPSTPAPLAARLAGDRRALVKHLIRALGGGLTELDHPPGSRWRRAAHTLRDLWAVADSVLDRRDLRGSLWWSPRGGARP